MPYPNTV